MSVVLCCKFMFVENRGIEKVAGMNIKREMTLFRGKTRDLGTFDKKFIYLSL